MDSKDQKIKRVWFVSALILLALSPIQLYVASLGIFPDESWKSTLTLFSGIATSIAYAAGYYFCAYKKPGIRFLTFSVVITALSYVQLAFGLYTGSVQALYSSFSLPMAGATFALQLLNIWVFILNFQLRKLNKKFQLSQNK